MIKMIMTMIMICV